MMMLATTEEAHSKDKVEFATHGQVDMDDFHKWRSHNLSMKDAAAKEQSNEVLTNSRMPLVPRTPIMDSK